MKLLRIGEKGREKPAALDNNGKIRDISSHIKDLNPSTLNFETISKIQNIDLSSLPEISSSERIGACITDPGKFVAIGLNYSDHAAETGAAVPTEPIMFMKATSSICGPNDDVEIVSGSKKLDWEVELGIVIGKNAKHISESQSQEHILGYCLVNDVSEREWQIEKMGQWVKGKSHDTYGPIGPYLVTKDEIKDVNNLNMTLDVNGERMQTGNTNTMIFNVDIIVSYVSKFMSLQAGDIITTGTPPGVGMGKKPQIFLKAGDQMKLSIDNLGDEVNSLEGSFDLSTGNDSDLNNNQTVDVGDKDNSAEILEEDPFPVKRPFQKKSPAAPEPEGHMLKKFSPAAPEGHAFKKFLPAAPGGHVQKIFRLRRLPGISQIRFFPPFRIFPPFPLASENFPPFPLPPFPNA